MDFNEITQEVLNNDIIKQLIQDTDTLAIYLGGSRLLDLELPKSDYDIIVISKNKAILGLFGESLSGLSINAHLQTIYFKKAIEWLQMPFENAKDIHMLCLFQMMWPDVLYFYKSSEFIAIQEVVNSHRNEMIYFCLEQLLSALDYPTVNKSYIKAHYHYICFKLILDNYIHFNELFLTSEQRAALVNLKLIRKIPKELLDSISEQIFKQYQLYYYKYIKIYQEVITCQKKFI